MNEAIKENPTVVSRDTVKYLVENKNMKLLESELNIIRQQMQTAFDRREIGALESLQAKEKMHIAAINLKEFGGDPNENPGALCEKESPEPRAQSPKPKKNPRPPIWESKTFIATRGIAGKIYFGYKEKPGQFKTKKAKRESGAKLYKNYHAFLKKFNLKPSPNLKSQRARATIHGGNLKLEALEKRTSKLPKQKPAPKKAVPTVRNKTGFTQEEENKAIALFERFMGREAKNVKIARLKSRSLIIKFGEAKRFVYQAKRNDGQPANYEHEFDGCNFYWDIENNAILIMGPDLEITKHGIEG